jgi:hypothetical protein
VPRSAATIGAMYEPGLDLHEWETRWQELQDALAEDPALALPDVVRFIEQLLRERGFQLDEPVTEEGEDADIIRAYLAARELAVAAEGGSAEPEDVEVTLGDLSDIYEYVAQDRAPP